MLVFFLKIKLKMLNPTKASHKGRNFFFVEDSYKELVSVPIH